MAAALLVAWTGCAAALESPPLPDSRPDAPALLVPLPGERPDAPSLDPLSPLYEHDIRFYREIFSAQQGADWATADRLIARLLDPLLMGHVLAQRYLHPTGWVSSYRELSDWLASFADHPDATRIWRLALRRQPEGARAPDPPRGRWSGLEIKLSLDDVLPEVDETPSAADPLTSSGRDVLRTVRNHVRKGRYSRALAMLQDPDVAARAGPLALDMAAGETAFGFFVHGDDAMARDIAEPAVRRSGHLAPLAGWSAGLAAWRQGDPAAAREMFRAISSGDAGDPLVVACAWWAARLSLLTGHAGDVGGLLEVAAREPYSMYGLLARHALGMEGELVNDAPWEPAAADIEAVIEIPAVRRSLALALVGQHHRGDREFNGLAAAQGPALALAVIHLAGEAGFPATLHRLAGEFLDTFALRLDHALYPVPPWEPEGGFAVEPALLYALMRQESHFRALSVSPAKARGVMQILPSTAAFVTGDRRFRHAGRYLLNDPAISVNVGESYVRHLLELPLVDGNLFLLLAAWNGGPGKLARWIDGSGPHEDPLLFVESFPLRETRSFIRKVMANYWIYSLRAGTAPASLAMAAGGDWPRYREAPHARH